MDNYEIERDMFRYIRRRNRLVEQSENTGDEANENDVIKPNNQDYQDEIKKFKSQITSRVDVETFLIYPETNNVVFGGKFNDLTEFSFEMSLSEKDGLYINTNNLQITDDIVNRIQKLNGYYKNWAEEWSNKIISEYK